MSVFYPYNEILPKEKAHDVFLFQECATLAKTGIPVSLLIGVGSKTKEELTQYYGVETAPTLEIVSLPIVRKNNILNISWNYPFFATTQRYIERHKPNWLICSVLKQGSFHFSRKVKGVKYLYEVHELSSYPTLPPSPNFPKEKQMLAQADQIVVTTKALKEILRAPPYALTNPIEVIPLAVNRKSLSSMSEEETFTLMYVGQLYEGQGIPLLLEAIKHTKNVKLVIVGGKEKEIAQYKFQNRHVDFLGFIPPKALDAIASSADAFVATFESVGRMPFVAHTKLYEYATWGRPFIAPNLPIVNEHFSEQNGVLFFNPGDAASLATCITRLQNKDYYRTLTNNCLNNVNRFTWEKRVAAYLNLL